MAFTQNTAKDAVAITPGSAALLKPVGAFRVGGAAGDVTVTTSKGTTLTIPNVQVGETISLGITHVTAATATGITGYIA